MRNGTERKSLRGWRGALGFLFLFLFPLLLSGAAFAAEEQALMLGGRSVLLSEDGAPGLKPLLLFSHDFGGCASQSSFLVQAFADAGYLVVAPNHKDARCRQSPLLPVPPNVILRQNPAFWSAVYRDRVQDFRRILEALRKGRAWRGKIDWTRVALIGHGVGGSVALGLLGAGADGLPSVSFRGALLFSPYLAPLFYEKRLSSVSAPFMIQAGMDEPVLLSSFRSSFSAFKTPHFLVAFSGVSHFGWTDARAQALPSLEAYSLAFLDAFVKGKRPSPLLYRKFGDAVFFRRN